jgi:tetratricopeptide (TPR) repeat protein/TolB-like protein
LASPATSWRRGSRAALVAVAATVVVLAAGGAWLRFGRPPAPPTLSGSRLLVAPFENLTGDPRLDYVGGIAADGLALIVAQSGSMDVVPSTTVLMASRDTSGGISERMDKLAAATHAGLRVSGSFARRGDSLVLQAQLTDLRTGTIVNTLDPQIGPVGDPIAVVNTLGDRLLAALGSREIALLPQRGFRAPKNAAYQEFAKGFERFVIHGDLVGARPYFARAIAIDPGYVRAYQLLQRMSINLGEYDRADSIARQIEKLPIGLSAAERLQQDYNNAELRGDIPTYLRSMQQLAARDSSPLSLVLVGEAGMFMLRPDLSIPAFEHAIATSILTGGRTAAIHLTWFAESYHQAASYRRELDLLTRNQSVFQDVSAFRGRKLRAYAANGDKQSAISLADTVLRLNDDSTGLAVMRVTNGAQEFRAHGDTVTAARLLATNRAWVAAHPPAGTSPNRQVSEGILFLLTGSSDSAIARFTLAAHNSNRIDAAGYLGVALVAHGDSVRARAIADSLGALGRPWLFGNHTFWRAAIVGAMGDRDLAMQLLQKAHSEGESMHPWHFNSALNGMRGYAPFDALMTPRR